MNHPTDDALDQATADYVLPKRPRGPGGLVVATADHGTMAGQRRAGEVARKLGERFVLLAECQQQYLAELRGGLQALAESVVEDARVKLQASVRSALAVLDWCDALQADLLAEGQRAARGWQPLDVVECSREVAATAAGAVAVIVTGATATAWWGDAGRFAEAIRAGLAVVTERIGARGAIRIEVAENQDGTTVRIAGTGEPNDEVDPAAVRAFRNAVERLGARVVPDVLGPGGAGLILLLPNSAG